MKISKIATETVKDINGNTYAIIEGRGKNRCRECAFNRGDECLAEEFGMPDCDVRADDKQVLYKRIN